MRYILGVASCLALAACSGTPQHFGNVTVGAGSLISGHSPPSPYSNNSEPQPPNSLPPGAEGIGASGPNARFPNAAAVTVPAPL